MRRSDRIVAVKSAAQCAPFFRLMQSTVSRGGGDEGMRLLHLHPGLEWAAEDAETVGALANEIARDTSTAEECHGLALVRTGGPDGRRAIASHIQRDRALR